MEFHRPASEPPDEKEMVCIPIIQIENPHFGKPYLTQFEALDAINILSDSLKEIERTRGPNE